MSNWYDGLKGYDELHVINQYGEIIEWHRCSNSPRCTARVWPGFVRAEGPYCWPCSGSGKSFEDVMQELQPEPAHTLSRPE